MKNLLAIAFIGALVLTSCSKKETETESNTMLPEPEVVVADTMKTDSSAKMAAPVATPMPADSAMAK